MVLKEINLGKQPIYYVQKSYRKENGRPATKNYERLGTLDELKVRFGEEDPIGCAKQYIAELTAAEKAANKKVIVEYSPTAMIVKGEQRCYNGGYLVPAEDLLRAGAGLHLQEDSEEAQAG